MDCASGYCTSAKARSRLGPRARTMNQHLRAPGRLRRATLDVMTDDPGAPVHEARGAEAQTPSLPPELVPQGARALLVGTAEPSHECENCGKPLSGRQVRSCSGRCRADLSRKRQKEARAARDQKIRSLLVAAKQAAGDLRAPVVHLPSASAARRSTLPAHEEGGV